MDAIHTRDPCHGTSPLQGGDFGSELQHPIEIDRVRGRGFVGASLGPIKDPVCRHDHEGCTSLGGGIGYRSGCRDVGLPGGSPVGVHQVPVVEDRAVDDDIGVEASDAASNRVGVTHVHPFGSITGVVRRHERVNSGHDVGTVVEGGVDDVAADESGAAGEPDLHCISLGARRVLRALRAPLRILPLSAQASHLSPMPIRALSSTVRARPHRPSS